MYSYLPKVICINQLPYSIVPYIFSLITCQYFTYLTVTLYGSYYMQINHGDQNYNKRGFSVFLLENYLSTEIIKMSHFGSIKYYTCYMRIYTNRYEHFTWYMCNLNQNVINPCTMIFITLFPKTRTLTMKKH